MCLFRVETLAFLAENRPLGSFTHCLLTYCKTDDFAVVVLLEFGRCTHRTSKIGDIGAC